MKKLIPVFFAIVVFVNSSAGQPSYSSAWSNVTSAYMLTSGFATTTTPGFLWCGSQSTVQLGGPWMSPANMNFYIKGLGLSSFWSCYKIFDSQSCQGQLTQVLNGFGVTAIEISGNLNTGSSQYALAGAYDQGCYFTTLDNGGIPVNSMLYPFPTSLLTNGEDPSRPLIVQAAGSGDFFIAGAVGGEIYMMRVSISGSIVWSKVYKFQGIITPKDMILDPYSPNKIILAGSNVNGGDSDGFLMEVDAQQGAQVAFTVYGTPNTFEDFKTIIPASSTSLLNRAGFLIGGSGEIPGGAVGSFLARTDQAGNIDWSHFLQPASGTNQGVVDVIERTNTSSRIEYYTLLASSAGMVVLKLDENGQPFPSSNTAPNNEFVYSMPGNFPARPASISQVAGNGSNAGIQVYGTSQNLLFSSSYMVSAYFNGQTNCYKTLLQQNPTYRMELKAYPEVMKERAGLAACSNFQVQAFFPGGAINFPCSGLMLSGNNARSIQTAVIENEDRQNIYSVSPNPVTDRATVRFQAQQNDKVVIEVLDVIGQRIASKELTAGISGGLAEELDFSGLDLPAGVYFINTTVAGESHKAKILYTH